MARQLPCMQRVRLPRPDRTVRMVSREELADPPRSALLTSEARAARRELEEVVRAPMPVALPVQTGGLLRGRTR